LAYLIGLTPIPDAELRCAQFEPTSGVGLFHRLQFPYVLYFFALKAGVDWNSFNV